MIERTFVMLLLAPFLITLTAGCATERSDALASLTASDASRSPLPHELVGTWAGWFRPVGVDGGGGDSTDGNMTLEIKDDGTYKLISSRRGRADVGASNESGVVIANDRTVTLKSSSGPWIPLTRNGSALYGVTKHRSTGYTIQFTLEKLGPS